MKCLKCQKFIAKERAEFLLETDRPHTCANCSEESEKLTLMEYGHKTAPSLIVVDDDYESQRLAWASYRRSR